MSSRARLERTFQASLDDVWDLWTTKEGFESWWGPDGFRSEVRKIEPRVGGETVYAMVAVGAEQIEFLRKAGMPLVSEDRLTCTELEPRRRLAYTHLVDFLPGVEPYRVGLSVDFETVAGGVRMVVHMDAMHDAAMTELAVRGMESQLERLRQRFA